MCVFFVFLTLGMCITAMAAANNTLPSIGPIVSPLPTYRVAHTYYHDVPHGLDTTLVAADGHHTQTSCGIALANYMEICKYKHAADFKSSTYTHWVSYPSEKHPIFQRAFTRWRCSTVAISVRAAPGKMFAPERQPDGTWKEVSTVTRRQPDGTWKADTTIEYKN